MLNKLISLIVRNINTNIIENILFKENIIKDFFNLRLIWYKLNIFFNNKYS